MKTTTKTLRHGEMNIIESGGVRFHVYNTKDALEDQSIIVEKDGKGVVIELPCFKDGIEEMTSYIGREGIDIVGKLVSYHAAGSTFLPGVRNYLTADSREYNTTGGGAGLVSNFVQMFGEGFDGSLANKGEELPVGKVELAGIEFDIRPNAGAFEVVVPSAKAVYVHMLGHDCHSIVPGPAAADAIADGLQGYLDEGIGIFMSSHYVPETRKDVETKIAYIRDLKRIASGCGSKQEFVDKVNAAYPGYSGGNYLDMTSGAFFPQ